MNSSVVELIELINGHIPDILFMEASNLSQIYLYRTDDYWVAFERSAFLLCRAYADSIITPMKVANAPTPIVMASVKVKVGSINSIFYFLHKAAEPFNCLEQDNLA